MLHIYTTASIRRPRYGNSCLCASRQSTSSWSKWPCNWVVINKASPEKRACQQLPTTYLKKSKSTNVFVRRCGKESASDAHRKRAEVLRLCEGVSVMQEMLQFLFAPLSIPSLYFLFFGFFLFFSEEKIKQNGLAVFNVKLNYTPLFVKDNIA